MSRRVAAPLVVAALVATLTACGKPPGTVVEVYPPTGHEYSGTVKVVERQYGFLATEMDYSWREVDATSSCDVGDRYEACR